MTVGRKCVALELASDAPKPQELDCRGAIGLGGSGAKEPTWRVGAGAALYYRSGARAGEILTDIVQQDRRSRVEQAASTIRGRARVRRVRGEAELGLTRR